MTDERYEIQQKLMVVGAASGTALDLCLVLEAEIR